MKTKQNLIRPIAFLLTFIMLLQGCTVYKSVPVSLEQAIQNESKVRVKTNSSERLKFNRIGVEDGNYYGVKKSNGVIVKTPLNQNFISAINEKDKTVSTILTIAIPVVIIGVGLVILGNSMSFGGGFGGGGFTY